MTSTFCHVIKVATHAHYDIVQLRDPATHPAKKACAIGGGHKCKAPKVCEALFSWFIEL